MSEMKFHKAFPFIRDEHNENVCRVITETSFVPQRDLTPFEIDARMNLIAAAPDLLAALKRAAVTCGYDCWCGRESRMSPCDSGQCRAARAAIAKAEGRTA